MERIYESDFLLIQIEKNSRITKVVWKAATEFMETEEMKKEVHKIADLIVIHKPLYHLANDSNHKYFYGVDEQQWVAKTIAGACAKVNLKKYVLLLPNEIIGKLSTTKVVEEAGKLPFEFRYMDNEVEALDWFNL
ncbi:hypothetical protein [Labilibaculum sp.]|uniref:hypothetical protein n=1 Tax=Labilibaculum sp. TaxID=2060723 RepID=UPI0035675863